MPVKADVIELVEAAYDLQPPDGAREAFGCVALDAEGRGIVLTTDLPVPTRLPRVLRSRWELLRAHIASGYRLRGRRVRRDDDCILAPGGRVVDARGDAQAGSARERLRDAVIRRDRARTRAVRADPEQALRLWPSLVSGRWSLVDRFERDGRRFVVARRNEPLPPSPLTLSLRERQVFRHLAQGDSVKLTAYALGLASSTVSSIGRSVLLKLGLRSLGVTSRARVAVKLGLTDLHGSHGAKPSSRGRLRRRG
jgi:DNA-binding CsgD family transcriptional regulator